MRSLPRIPFHNAKSTRVCFNNREYRIDRGVFDPAAHVSGMLFATYLNTQNWYGQRILEIGTGCGLLAGVLDDQGASVVAVDVSRRAAQCARANLADSSVEVRHGDLWAPLEDERFDVLVTNPPYEIGRSWQPRYRSPNVLERLASGWKVVADRVVLAFPTDSAHLLTNVGFELSLVARLPSQARELGVFSAQF